MIANLILSVLLALFVGREVGKFEVRRAIRQDLLSMIQNNVHQHHSDEDDDPQWTEDML